MSEPFKTGVPESWYADARGAIARGKDGVPYQVRGRGDRIEVFHPSAGYWSPLLPHFANDQERDEAIRRITP